MLAPLCIRCCAGHLAAGPWGSQLGGQSRGQARSPGRKCLPGWPGPGPPGPCTQEPSPEPEPAAALSCSGARPLPGPPGAPLEGVPLRPDPDPGGGGAHGGRVPDLQAAQRPPAQQDPAHQPVRGGQRAGQQVPVPRPRHSGCVRPSPGDRQASWEPPSERKDAWTKALAPGFNPSLPPWLWDLGRGTELPASVSPSVPGGGAPS